MHVNKRTAHLISCLVFVCISVATDTWVVRQDGFGPVKVGMTLAQLNNILHEKFTVPADNDNQGCFYVKPEKYPHVSFMIEDGHLTRVDVDAAGLATASGIQVGDTEAHAKEVYGQSLTIGPHYYTDGHYLTLRSNDGQYGIRFETTKQGKIEMFYAGKYDAVQYVEGCS